MAERKVARAKKIVTLSAPIEWAGKTVSEIELREPSGAEYVRHGDPRVLVRSQTGSGYFVEQNDVIEKYFEALINHEAHGAILSLLSLEDTMAVKMAMLDFFLVASTKISARGSTA